jgi:hypothetical protein
LDVSGITMDSDEEHSKQPLPETAISTTTTTTTTTTTAANTTTATTAVTEINTLTSIVDRSPIVNIAAPPEWSLNELSEEV